MFSYDQNGRILTRSDRLIHSGRHCMKNLKISVVEKIIFIFYTHVSNGVLSGILFEKAFAMMKSPSDIRTGG